MDSPDCSIIMWIEVWNISNLLEPNRLVERSSSLIALLHEEVDDSQLVVMF